MPHYTQSWLLDKASATTSLQLCVAVSRWYFFALVTLGRPQHSNHHEDSATSLNSKISRCHIEQYTDITSVKIYRLKLFVLKNGWLLRQELKQDLQLLVASCLYTARTAHIGTLSVWTLAFSRSSSGKNHIGSRRLIIFLVFAAPSSLDLISLTESKECECLKLEKNCWRLELLSLQSDISVRRNGSYGAGYRR